MSSLSLNSGIFPASSVLVLMGWLTVNERNRKKALGLVIYVPCSYFQIIKDKFMLIWYS